MRYTKEQFQQAVEKSISVAQALTYLGLKPSGGNYKSFYLHTKKWSVSTVHFKGQSHLQGTQRVIGTTISLDDILIENSTYTSNPSLKKKLFKAGVKRNICENCGLDSWLGEELALHLHHQNGNHYDNRIENLAILCPNCHGVAHKKLGRMV